MLLRAIAKNSSKCNRAFTQNRPYQVNQYSDQDPLYFDSSTESDSPIKKSYDNEGSHSKVTRVSIIKLVSKAERTTLSVPISLQSQPSILSTLNLEPFNILVIITSLRITKLTINTTQKTILIAMPKNNLSKFSISVMFSSETEINPPESTQTRSSVATFTIAVHFFEICAPGNYSINNLIRNHTFEILAQKFISKTVTIKMRNNGNELANFIRL
uniref:Uncharacterized protein n=1 Tax=Glossina palpalis gambiensis TaxID=67801 RepID=A0A1B0C058_9MUSC